MYLMIECQRATFARYGKSNRFCYNHCMAKQVSNEEIAASVGQAEELLKKLELTDEERDWAKEQAKVQFKNVTDALLDSGRAFRQLRGLAVPAAFAYALIIAKDWATNADDLAQS